MGRSICDLSRTHERSPRVRRGRPQGSVPAIFARPYLAVSAEGGAQRSRGQGRERDQGRGEPGQAQRGRQRRAPAQQQRGQSAAGRGDHGHAGDRGSAPETFLPSSLPGRRRTGRASRAPPPVLAFGGCLVLCPCCSS